MFKIIKRGYIYAIAPFNSFRNFKEPFSRLSFFCKFIILIDLDQKIVRREEHCKVSDINKIKYKVLVKIMSMRVFFSELP